MPLCASAAFEVPVLICRLGVNACPSALNAPQNWASVLGRPSVSPPPVPVSLRASYQATARFPVLGSSEILGRNWLLVVASSLTRTGVLQLEPWLSEYRTSTS